MPPCPLDFEQVLRLDFVICKMGTMKIPMSRVTFGRALHRTNHTKPLVPCPVHIDGFLRDLEEELGQLYVDL